MSAFQQTLAAGEQAIFPAGDHVTLASAEYPVTIELRRDGKRIARASNVPASWYWHAPTYDDRAEAFDEVRVTSDTAQTVQVIIERGQSGVQAISGSVQVLESYRAAALNEYAVTEFYANISGQQSGIQLWNPAGSGEVFVVDAITVRSDVAGGFSLYGDTTELGTVGQDAVNKYLGGPSKAGVCREASSASPPGDDFGSFFPAGADISLDLITAREARYMVPPGYGLAAFGPINARINVTFRFKVIAE